MNYKKIYMQLIDSSKNNDSSLYLEKHHIVPKCLGGKDINKNISYLTPKQHFIAHALLTKIFKDDYRILLAFYAMKAKSKFHGERYFNSKLYNSCREKLYGSNGILIGINSPWFGRKHTEESKKRMSDIAKLRCANPTEKKRLKDLANNRTKEHAEKIQKSLIGRKVSEQTIEKMRNSHIGKQTGSLNGKSKKCHVDGKEYESVRIAHKHLNEQITIENLYYRINSKKWKNYYYV